MNNVIGNIRTLHVGPNLRDGRTAQDPSIPVTVRLRAIFAIRIVERLADIFTVSFLFFLVFYIEPLSSFLTHALFAGGASGTSFDLRFPCLAFTSLVTYLCVESCGTYRLTGGLLHIRETACLLRAVSIPCGALLGVCLLYGYGLLALLVASVACVLLFTLLLQKHLFRSGVRRLRRSLGLEHRALIFGSQEFTKPLKAALACSSRLGMIPVLTVHPQDAAFARETVEDEDPPRLSASHLRAHGIDTILVTYPHPDRTTTQGLTDLATELCIPILFMAGAPSTEQARVSHFDLDGQQLYGLDLLPQADTHRWTSRLLDIFTSVAMLLLFALPMGIAAVLVYLSSPGPILFRQERVGQNGKHFTILKFRTMYTESCGSSVSPETSRDPRVTPIGRFLRQTSLDELPQLINVLRGDMAVVGPRPEMPFIVAGYGEIHRKRLRVRPGLTGIWQISEHRAAPIHENIAYDLYYLNHRSVSVDVAVLLHTVIVAARGI